MTDQTSTPSSDTDFSGKQTPVDAESRKVLDDTKSEAKSSAKPEANAGSGFIAAKDEPTQEEEQA